MFMTTTIHPNGIAPRPTFESGGRTIAFGAKGGRMVEVWQYIWDNLSTTEWKSSASISQDAADRFGMQCVSVVEMLTRMRKAGVLEKAMLPVRVKYVQKNRIFTANRPVVHYRIAK